MSLKCTRACFYSHVMFNDSIMYNSCTHVSCGGNIILPYYCTVNI